MKILPVFIASAITFSIAPAAVITTVGVYDPTGGQNNAVDTVATGTQTLADVTAFTGAVSTAFTNGFGGVANFDVDATFTATTTLNMSYATGAKTLLVSSDVAQNSTAVNSSSGSVLAISGANVLTRASGAANDTTFTFGGITGGAEGEGLTTFAFTILERNTFAVEGIGFSITAFFSNGTNSGVVSSTIGNTNLITANKALDDTFWSFTAPEGATITSIFVDSTAATGTGTAVQPVFDDVAFITSIVPEPSTSLMAFAGIGFVVLRRKR